MPGHVLTGRAALEVARGTREEADLIDAGRDLLADRQRERLARVLGLEARELLAAGLELVGDLQQREAALGGRRLAPLEEGGARGLDGGVDVGLAGDAHLGDDLAGRGVAHFVHAVAAGRHAGSADEVL